MREYVRADLSCADCHLAAGTQPRGGSLVGVYGRLPQWNKRAHRVIALQDRIAECFLRSMNGKAPDTTSAAQKIANARLDHRASRPHSCATTAEKTTAATTTVRTASSLIPSTAASG